MLFSRILKYIALKNFILYSNYYYKNAKMLTIFQVLKYDTTIIIRIDAIIISPSTMLTLCNNATSIQF